MLNKTKVKKTSNLLIKIGIVLAAYGFLYYQLFYNERYDNILKVLDRYADSSEVKITLLVVLLLMGVNWIIEAFKWRYLMSNEERISVWKSVKAVFSGITVSIFTPNRMGEFLGRVFILKKTNHWRAIFITIIGSYSQLLVTLLVGFVSYIIFSLNYLTEEQLFSTYLFYAITTVVGCGVLVLVLLYLNVRILDPIVNRLINSRWKKVGQYFSVFSRFDTHKLVKVFLFSLLRYSVFTFQFILLLKAFEIPVTVLQGIMLITLMFFVMSAIPTVTLAELGVRGSVSIAIFKIFLEHKGLYQPEMEFGVFSASSVLWLINLALPALIGTFFIFQLKFFPKNGTK